MTIEVDAIRGQVRRTLDRLRVEADELAGLATGVQGMLAEMSPSDPAREVQRVAVLVRAFGGGLLVLAARLSVGAAKIEALAEIADQSSE